jgi:tetratricopeptide (TPR) repeat protein
LEGNAALERGDARLAEELYAACIALAPQSRNAHVYFSNRALARMVNDDAAGSAEDANAAVQLSPGYARGWRLLGTALQQQGQLRDAESVLQRCLSLATASQKELMKDDLQTVRRLIAAGESASAGSSPR